MMFAPKIKFVFINTAFMITGILAVTMSQFLIEILFAFIKPYLFSPVEATISFLLFKSISSAVTAVIVYYFFVKYIERRQSEEIDFSYFLKETSFGIFLGILFITSIVVILFFIDNLRFGEVFELKEILNGLRVAIISGVVEEIIFRGLVFRFIQKMFGTWIALLASSLLFGFSHLANPNATLWSSTAITIEAGLLLGSFYILTNRLWIPIGLHFGWNLTQGGIFNIPVSGHDVGGIIQVRLIGDPLISGGSFGLENSVIAVILCAVVSATVIIKAVKSNKIVKPFEKFYKINSA